MEEILYAGKVNIYVSKAHRFGSDAVALAEFAAPRVKRGSGEVCDLCSGCGAVGFMLAERAAHVTLAEIDVEAHELAARTAAKCGFNVTALRGDLRGRDFLREIGSGSMDVVTVNPPYYKEGSGYAPVGGARLKARHDGSCTLADAAAAAAFLLKYGGLLYMCIIPDRLVDAVCELRGAGLEPKQIRFLEWLCLIEAKKGGRAGVKLHFQP